MNGGAQVPARRPADRSTSAFELTRVGVARIRQAALGSDVPKQYGSVVVSADRLVTSTVKAAPGREPARLTAGAVRAFQSLAGLVGADARAQRAADPIVYWTLSEVEPSAAVAESIGPRPVPATEPMQRVTDRRGSSRKALLIVGTVMIAALAAFSIRSSGVTSARPTDSLGPAAAPSTAKLPESAELANPGHDAAPSLRPPNQALSRP